MAKRNYEALNEQLIEELPHFLQLVLNMLQHTLIVLVQLQFKFHTDVHTLLERLTDSANKRPRVPLQSGEIQETHSRALAEVTSRLIQLSIVPTYLAGALKSVTSQQRMALTERENGGKGDGGREGESEGVREEESEGERENVTFSLSPLTSEPEEDTVAEVTA